MNAVVIALAYGSVMGQLWWISAILLPFAIAATGPIMWAICARSPGALLWHLPAPMYTSPFSVEDAAIVSLAFAELALVIAVFAWLGPTSRISQPTASRAIARGSLAALVPFFGSTLVFLYCPMLWRCARA